ncbi:glycosyl transferase [Anaerocolumna cellulosilytica]|uniref:Glycosyl transferase n=1 Tax=Anaerocolumna cellulosilytica TaxID=433286 RepID=A0A6S6R472_9FIRM|nr:glycosyl hydrolase family 65 protein [Anaerocolumna cellulosilytica]MBB5195624.1 cellobiose phosphorylase [Anaerocolumna cellulosilytica]BCJ93868.1 glycosyl transferase [Anaerocolumna cellulosilytica]
MYQFHNEKKEITFDKYNTPTPWMNYLSNGTFHTMISQAGGGVAFYKSPQIFRINHYRFFHLPTDRSGFYTYINDGQEIWCPTSEPCKNKPDWWQSTHGMGYTRFQASKNHLEVTATYLVGKYENTLIWNLKIKSAENKKISIYPYVELGMMEFMRELQWQCYNKHQLSVYNREDILIYHYGVEEQPKPAETPLVYFASDASVSGFDCDRDEFIGSYRSEENPFRVEKNACSGSTLYGGDPCFALQLEVDLKAGEEKEINIFLGTAMTEEEVIKSVQRCRQKGFVNKSFEVLLDEWEAFLGKFKCELPDKEAETMINIWNPYQMERNFQFSRNISYYATGTFRGVGVRDTAQDILAMIPFDLNRAKEKLNSLFTQQYKDGHCNHYFYPNEGWEPITRIHSDNHLWLVMDVYHIVMEEGKLDYLLTEVSFYDGGADTVWNHIKKSIAFTRQNLGERGFPLMLSSDWNDMLYKVCRQGKGESIWTSMQFGTVLQMMVQLSQLMKEDGKAYLKLYEEQKRLINSTAWDGAWFRRCITDEGTFIGSEAEAQAKIWLNTQSWAVISGMGEPQKQLQAMDSVKKYLDTDYGIKKIHPSMKDYPTKEDPLTHYNKGCGENGSIFCHANTWAIIAECMLGRSELAFKYYQQLLPMVVQDKAGEYRYKAEPYVYASNIFGPESDKFGLANVSWLTGTAAWMHLAATQYILGIKAKWEGLEIAPCIPEEWKEVKIDREFRGCKYHITIKNKGKKVFLEHVEGRKEFSVEI